MKLSEIIKGLTSLPEPGSQDPEIGSIHYSSRDVVPDGLFVAIEGMTSDGHAYIGDALERGAAAIIAQKPVDTGSVPLVIVPDSREALALSAASFYGKPSEKMHVTGITGTNGKTTVTYILEEIFTRAGLKVGVIGTVNTRYLGQVYPNPMTTPESLDLQRILAQMHQAGVTHVIMEVSSHAIDLSRVCGTFFDTGVFTNLTQDHLDYHETMDGYWACKRRFFTELLPSGPKAGEATAVINCLDERGGALVPTLTGQVISTGGKEGTIREITVDMAISGTSGTISTPAGDFEFTSRAIGHHNLENMLNATGAALAAGIPVEAIQKGLAGFTVPGRLEQVAENKGFSVFVDYAHTPDALEKALASIKSLTPGRVITVFGCGGDRDRTKRPLMGQVAEAVSDLCVVTSDNPRTEEPDLIIKDILEGMDCDPAFMYEAQVKNQDGAIWVEPDRRKAIGLSVAAAAAGDAILIAGKGHEDYQIIGRETLPFDDREEALKALREI